MHMARFGRQHFVRKGTKTTTTTKPQPPAASGSTGDRNRVEFILMNNAQTHTRTERVYRHLNPARHRLAHRRYRNMMRGR